MPASSPGTGPASRNIENYIYRNQDLSCRFATARTTRVDININRDKQLLISLQS